MILQVVYSVFCFVIGCCMGSFLGLCAVRLQREESLWRPRSHCDSCGHGLGVQELVPLAGYFLSDGRCRYCGAPIPARYFWQEAVTGLLFLLVGIQTAPGPLLLVRWGILSLLLLLSFLDLAELQLYEELFYPLGLLVLAYRYLAGFSLSQGALGALVLGGSLELLHRWKPRGLGAGDPKLMGLLGFWLGTFHGGESLLWAVGGAFLFALWRGLQAPRGRRLQAWHAPIPFAPFLCGAAFFLECRQWGLPFGEAPLHSLPLALGALEIAGSPGLGSLGERVQKLLRRLQPWPRTLLSVVLGEQKLVLLQARRRNGLWEGERYLEMVWPERLRSALEHCQAEPVAQWLQAVCAKRGFTAQTVSLSLAPEWTELRDLSLPGLSWKQQQEEAQWEILQQVAYPAGSFSLSLQPHPDQDGQVLAELLLERRRAFLGQLTGLLGWKPLRVEPLAQSWGRLFQQPALVLLLLRQDEGISYGWYGKGCLLAAGNFSPEEIPSVDQLPDRGKAGFGFSLRAGAGEHPKNHLPLLAKGTLAGALSLLVLGAGLRGYWSVQQERQEARLRSAAGWETLWQEARARQRTQQQQQEKLQNLERKQLPWTSFLTLLGTTLPADCQVVRVQQEAGKEQPGFSLEGRSLSRQAVLQFAKRLQKQPGLTGVRLERLEEQPEERPSVRFALHGQWKAGSHES